MVTKPKKENQYDLPGCLYCTFGINGQIATKELKYIPQRIEALIITVVKLEQEQFLKAEHYDGMRNVREMPMASSQRAFKPKWVS